jgi:hypothetical protein
MGVYFLSALQISAQGEWLFLLSGLCKIYISEHRDKSTSRSGFRQRRHGQPQTRYQWNCSFIPWICGDPTVDPSCPSESFLHPLPSAWNTSTLVLFFPSSTRSILLTLEMSHHISFPTDTIFSVNSPSISTKPTRIPSYLPDMPSALHNHFYLSPLITRDLCIPLSFDDHKLTDLKEDSICLWP